jgi:(2Fe-2S) ferredoxin
MYPQILKLLQDLELQDQGITVRDCGCLGNCGSGPNCALLPQGTIVTGVGTPNQAFKLATEYAGADVGADDITAVAVCNIVQQQKHAFLAAFGSCIVLHHGEGVSFGRRCASFGGGLRM